MKYLLDTDHISLLQRRSGNAFANLLLRMSQHPSSDFCLSMVSFHEQVLGAHDFILLLKPRANALKWYSSKMPD
jgi:tRNA(fMet)-specific endonuclease VapC